ncbi:MAG: GNAT family N-acetyltransferase [Acidimicrobiia bacterium]|jgi:ribosomal protein S18 acetylase RimI-like enzyme
MGSLDSPGLTVRAAEASEADAAVFARLLDQAQGGWYRMALGSSAGRLIGASFLKPNHELSYEFVTMVERDGKPVGMCSAYSGRVHTRFASNPLDQAAHGRFRFWAMTKLSDRMLSFIANVPSDDYYIRALAIDPDQRGHGIGTLLLNVLTEAARASGCQRLALDVAATNKGARRLYERVGLVQEAESARFFGLPNTNVLRMVSDL